MVKEAKEHEYEFLSHGKRERSMGTVWWTGKKIDSDSDSLLNMLKSTTINGLTMDDGIKYLQALPMHYRSYMIARKVQ